MVASGLMAVMVGVPLAVPASAEELYTACSWTGTQTQDDRTCTGAVFDYGGQVTRSTCWQYRPSDRSSVQMLVNGRWYRQWENVFLRVRRNVAQCGATYPWKTTVTVPAWADQVGTTVRYRLVMPRTYQYTRTVWPVNVCTLPAASEGWCV
jgi:hypothetical protein